jgi:hypothetical protein
MKRSIFSSSLMFVLLMANGMAFGQQGCEFNIVGTWSTATHEGANQIIYRFASDGTLTLLSRPGPGQDSELREVARAAYKLDESRAPKTIEVKAINGLGIFPQGKTSMQITQFDDSAFTTVSAGSGPNRWIREEPSRYFVVFAARSGRFPDVGPAFAMLIKTNGSQIQVETVGLYSDNGRRTIGPIPAELYGEFMKEPKADSDVMLRLEVSRAQFERSLRIVQNWQRRAREHNLLYPPSSPRGLSLNNSVLLKEIAECLNQCSEKIKLYTLNWAINDQIAVNYNARQVPFQYLKRLRQLNDKIHVRDEVFQGSWQPISLPPGR